MTTVFPAYGRNYANRTEALADWFADKDFYDTHTRLACNRQDIGDDVVIRYGKGYTKTTDIRPGDYDAFVKARAADRATRPVYEDFDAWLKAVDVECIAASGLGYQDLPDWDFRTAFDDGIDPKTAAQGVIADAWN
jgi:hypothetical protein